MLSLLPLPTLAAQSVELASGDWEPFLGPQLPNYGFGSAIVSAAFREVGLEPVYHFYPWARASMMVQNGAIDGSVVWSRTEDREAYAIFSDPVLTLDVYIYHLKSHPMEGDKVEDFYGLRMATPMGSTLGMWQKAVEAKLIKNYSIGDYRSAFAQLLLEHYDFFPASEMLANFAMRTTLSPEQAARITHTAKPIARIAYCLMLSKTRLGNEDLLRQFNHGLAEIRRKGVYAQLERDFNAGKFDVGK